MWRIARGHVRTGLSWNFDSFTQWLVFDNVFKIVRNNIIDRSANAKIRRMRSSSETRWSWMVDRFEFSKALQTNDVCGMMESLVHTFRRFVCRFVCDRSWRLDQCWGWDRPTVSMWQSDFWRTLRQGWTFWEDTVDAPAIDVMGVPRWRCDGDLSLQPFM